MRVVSVQEQQAALDVDTVDRFARCYKIRRGENILLYLLRTERNLFKNRCDVVTLLGYYISGCLTESSNGSEGINSL